MDQPVTGDEYKEKMQDGERGREKYLDKAIIGSQNEFSTSVHM